MKLCVVSILERFRVDWPLAKLPSLKPVPDKHIKRMILPLLPCLQPDVEWQKDMLDLLLISQQACLPAGILDDFESTGLKVVEPKNAQF